jgi:hypothetical protein
LDRAHQKTDPHPQYNTLLHIFLVNDTGKNLVGKYFLATPAPMNRYPDRIFTKSTKKTKKEYYLSNEI